jgi:hypothetical protein
MKFRQTVMLKKKIFCFDEKPSFCEKLGTVKSRAVARLS